MFSRSNYLYKPWSQLGSVFLPLFLQSNSPLVSGCGLFRMLKAPTLLVLQTACAQMLHTLCSMTDRYQDVTSDPTIKYILHVILTGFHLSLILQLQKTGPYVTLLLFPSLFCCCCFFSTTVTLMLHSCLAVNHREASIVSSAAQGPLALPDPRQRSSLACYAVHGRLAS